MLIVLPTRWGRQGCAGNRPRAIAAADRFAAVVHRQLLIDVRGVPLRGPLRNDQTLRDFFGAEPLGQERQDLQLTPGQGLDQVCLGAGRVDGEGGRDEDEGRTR